MRDQGRVSDGGHSQSAVEWDDSTNLNEPVRQRLASTVVHDGYMRGAPESAPPEGRSLRNIHRGGKL